jgi:hypothetical protein
MQDRSACILIDPLALIAVSLSPCSCWIVTFVRPSSRPNSMRESFVWVDSTVPAQCTHPCVLIVARYR